MSETHSTISQSSSRAVPEASGQAAAILDVFDLLAHHGAIGLAWLDRNLVAVDRFGAMADLVPLGERVTDTVLPLLGMDECLQEVSTVPDKVFEMPNVAIINVDGRNPRLNLRVFWMAQRNQYLLLISRVLATRDLEIGLAQQVRARMIVEAELAQKSRALAAINDELTRANRDLAEFAYIISHDLKSPLRAMRYHADNIEAALITTPVEGVKACAAQIRAQSRRMSHMLTDLLAYSKIGRATNALSEVDSRALIESIVATLPHPGGISVAIAGEWPTFETYAAPLDLILRNLITNAITHHDRDQGVVTVTATLFKDALQIEVADDGAGIDPAWHEAIFQPFRTIENGAAHTEQSGIGLALVRKTVETSGARLLLLSDPKLARGSTFVLNWPLKHLG
jgi:signal transduction histidine kinase